MPRLKAEVVLSLHSLRCTQALGTVIIGTTATGPQLPRACVERESAAFIAEPRSKRPSRDQRAVTGERECEGDSTAARYSHSLSRRAAARSPVRERKRISRFGCLPSRPATLSPLSPSLRATHSPGNSPEEFPGETRTGNADALQLKGLLAFPRPCLYDLGVS